MHSKKTSYQIGLYSEFLARWFLRFLGYRILKNRYITGKKTGRAEIDIIAKDNNTLVFVEVKTRSTTNFGLPIEAIDNKKLSQIKTIAKTYIMQSDKKYKDYRIDAICVMLNPQEIKHLKGIF